MTTYGIIGLGHIGRRFAASARERGASLRVFDVVPEATATLTADEVAGSPAEVARDADVVIISVLTAAQVRDVVTGPDGILAGATPGTRVVVTSTVDVPTVRDLAAICAEKQVCFADCGVTTVPGMPADSAFSVVSMVGTDDDALVAAIEQVSAAAVRCGVVGAGMATKIARNVLTYGSWAVAAAASRLLESAGLDPALLQEVVERADPEGRTMFMLEREIGFGAESRAQRERIATLVEKDLGAAIDLERSTGGLSGFAEFVSSHRAELLRLVAADAPADAPDDDGSEAESRYERGRRWMDRVYGPGFHDASVARDGTPYNTETIEHLFGEIWSRPGLSLRDRRLLVMGASAQTGRADLLEVQVYGGLVNHEFSASELEEIMLQLVPYIGWTKASAVNRGIRAARARIEAERAEQDA